MPGDAKCQCGCKLVGTSFTIHSIHCEYFVEHELGNVTIWRTAKRSIRVQVLLKRFIDRLMQVYWDCSAANTTLRRSEYSCPWPSARQNNNRGKSQPLLRNPAVGAEGESTADRLSSQCGRSTAHSSAAASASAAATPARLRARVATEVAQGVAQSKTTGRRAPYN